MILYERLYEQLKNSLCVRRANEQMLQTVKKNKVMYSPDHPLFKTSLCRHWLNGTCARGDACNFAHGTAQLRQHYDDAAMVCTSINWEPRNPILLHSEHAILDGGKEHIPMFCRNESDNQYLQGGDFICINIKDEQIEEPHEEFQEAYRPTQAESDHHRWGAQWQATAPAGDGSRWFAAAEPASTTRPKDHGQIEQNKFEGRSHYLQTTDCR